MAHNNTALPHHRPCQTAGEATRDFLADEGTDAVLRAPPQIRRLDL